MSVHAPSVPTVGVNLLWLVPGEVGGSEEYTVGVLRALAERGREPGEPDVVLFANDSLADAHPDLVAAFSTAVAPLSGRSRATRVLAESTWLAAETRRRALAAVHHAGGTMPRWNPAPGLVTLHDLQPLSHPERFSLLKRTYLRAVVPGSLRRACLVVTLTGFTAQDAVDRCGVDPRRLRRVPSGVDPAPPPLSADDEAALRARYDLVDRRIVLYPAITYPHKNHETLLGAFGRLVSRHPDLVLVLTGGAGSAEGVVAASIEARGLGAVVRRPGRVPAADLDALYAVADVLAFPSSYEGFGLPALEALRHGCPVVASDVGGLPSVVGDAAVLVDPYDGEAWSEALSAVLDEPERRSRLRAAAARRVAALGWPAAADALASVYAEAVTIDRRPPRAPKEQHQS